MIVRDFANCFETLFKSKKKKSAKVKTLIKEENKIKGYHFYQCGICKRATTSTSERQYFIFQTGYKIGEIF